MDPMAGTEDLFLNQRLQQRINEVQTAAKTHLSAVTDHVNFTLQQAYFKCAHNCFDRRRQQEEIGNCVEHCSVPVLNAQNMVESEMAKFQDRLNRSLVVCKDKFEAARLQDLKTNAVKDLESCVDQSVQENIKSLPHLAARLKTSLSINEHNSI